jgi:hypothetical protein
MSLLMKRALAVSALALTAACSSNPAPVASPPPEPTVDPEPTPNSNPVEPPDVVPPVVEIAKSHPDARHLRFDPAETGSEDIDVPGAELRVSFSPKGVAVQGLRGNAPVALGAFAHPVVVEIFADDPHLWVIGFKLGDDGQPIWTDGRRFKLADFTAAGSFEGEGITDYNSIDLDEQ